jgi:hypothetical protein
MNRFGFPAIVALVIATPLLTTGCATSRIGPSSEPSDTPPRIMRDDDTYRWDNPRAFGPVPEELQEKGDAYCQGNGYERADGYHPKALDENGNTYVDGGFFCVGRIDDDKKRAGGGS